MAKYVLLKKLSKNLLNYLLTNFFTFNNLIEISKVKKNINYIIKTNSLIIEYINFLINNPKLNQFYNNIKVKYVEDNLENIIINCFYFHSSKNKDIKYETICDIPSTYLKKILKTKIIDCNILVFQISSILYPLTSFCVLSSKNYAIGDNNDVCIFSIHNHHFQDLKVLRGHSSIIQIIIETSDCKVVSGSSDNTIRIWEPNLDYSCKNILRSHTGEIKGICEISHKMIASTSLDNTIRIWDGNKNYQLIKILDENYSYNIRSISYLKIGFLVTGYLDKIIRIWDINDFTPVKLLEVYYDIFSICEISDKLFASGSGNNIRIWNTKQDFKCINILKGHNFIVYSLCKMSEKLLISGSRGEILVWDISNKFECLKVLKGHEQRYIKYIYKISEEIFASATYNDRIIQWKFIL